MVLFSLLIVIAWPVTDTWLLSVVGTEAQKQKAKACSPVGQFWTLPRLNRGSLHAVAQGAALLKDGCCSGASGEVAEPCPYPCTCALLSLRRRALQHCLKALCFSELACVEFWSRLFLSILSYPFVYLSS